MLLSKDFETIFFLCLAFEAALIVMCGVFWIGTWFSVGVDRDFVQWYTVGAITILVFTFLTVYQGLNKSLRFRKGVHLEWFMIALVIIPVLFLSLSNTTPVLIGLAGYYIGLVMSEILFWKRSIRSSKDV
jgi:hypothetical protein